MRGYIPQPIDREYQSGRLMLIVVISPALISLLTLGMLSLQLNFQPILYLALLAAWPSLALTIPLIARRPTFWTERNDTLAKFMILMSVLAVGYFVLWAIGGLLAGQHIKDALGSTLRATSPFLVFLSVMWLAKRSAIDKRREAITKSFRLLVGVAVLGALGKIGLIATNNWDAWGLGGYAGPTYALFFLTVVVLTKKTPGRKKAVASALIFLLVAATVLSLKRNAWVVLFLTPFLFIFLFRPRMSARLVAFSVVVIVVSVIAVDYLGFEGIVYDRVQYTFQSGSDLSDFDNSSAGRIHEMVSAMGTIGHTAYPVSLITGLGPGAGYENLTGWNFKNFNELGEPYDIHSGYIMILFRYGIFGLAIYATFFFAAIKLALSSRALLKRSNQLHTTQGYALCIIVGAAATHILLIVPAMIASNGLFGNWEVGAILALGISARGLAKLELK